MEPRKSLDKLIFILLAQLVYVYTPYSYTSPTLKPYVNEVQNIVNAHCRKEQYATPLQILYHFDNLSDPTLAMCTRNKTSYTISVDRTSWRMMDETSRFTVMTHEMVHCLFNAGHNPDEGSFMYERLNPQLSREEVRWQFEQILLDKCGR